jgi:GlpG protein
MIVWLIFGFIGVLELFGFGSIANFAHLGGLLSGYYVCYDIQEFI